VFRHVVLFRVRDDVADPEVSEAMSALGSLGAGEGIESWLIELSLDRRKGRVIVEDATFSDRAAFLAWRADAAHQRVAARLALIADWWVGDWDTSTPPDAATGFEEKSGEDSSE